MKYLTTAQAAQILAVHPNTLKSWESQGALDFKVARTEGNHRRYSQDDIEQLRERMRGGWTPAAPLTTEHTSASETDETLPLAQTGTSPASGSNDTLLGMKLSRNQNQIISNRLRMIAVAQVCIILLGSVIQLVTWVIGLDPHWAQSMLRSACTVAVGEILAMIAFAILIPRDNWRRDIVADCFYYAALSCLVVIGAIAFA